MGSVILARTGIIFLQKPSGNTQHEVACRASDSLGGTTLTTTTRTIEPTAKLMSLIQVRTRHGPIIARGTMDFIHAPPLSAVSCQTVMISMI